MCPSQAGDRIMADVPRQRVLVVEDDALSRRVLASILEPDYTIVMAATGRQALERASVVPAPDLVLLDLLLPDQDGYSVLLQLRASAVTASIPVIVVSVLNSSGAEIKGLEHGAIDYISKPFHPALVRARVRNHMALAEARRQLEQQNRALQEAARMRDDVDQILRHDLKSPVSTILAAARYMRDEDTTEQENRVLNGEIIAVSEKMLNSMERYLLMSQIEAGIYRFAPRPVDVIGVLERVARDLKRILPDHQVPFRIECGASTSGRAPSVTVQGDEALVSTMFSNLMKNAMEASPPNGEIVARVDAGPPCSISLRNLGEVPTAIRDHFFEKYATRGKFGGTGLGCYSARLIVGLLGGTIALDTSESGATTLLVTLPT